MVIKSSFILLAAFTLVGASAGKVVLNGTTQSCFGGRPPIPECRRHKSLGLQYNQGSNVADASEEYGYGVIVRFGWNGPVRR